MLQQVSSLSGYARCECHECTQARWKMSFQGQVQVQRAIGQEQTSAGIGQALQTSEAWKAYQQQQATNRS